MLRQRGVTLIELMIAVVIIGVLASLAVPSFQGYIAKVRVRSTAESFAHALQLARTEAIKRNSRTAFIFSSTGNWEVCASSNSTCPTADSIEVMLPSEASHGVVSIVPTPSTAVMTTFTSMGRQYTDATSALKNPDGTAEVTEINFSSSATNQTYRVVISQTGSSKLCDPSLPSTNAKACP